MKLAYISTYPPRECGIATFNNNLLQAIGYDKKMISNDSFVVAMNDSESLNIQKRLNTSSDRKTRKIISEVQTISIPVYVMRVF